MSGSDDMIKTLCPDGVEFVKLGEVCEILDCKRKPITKAKRKKGIYPYYGANGIQDYVDGFIFDGTFLLFGEDGSVINKDKSPVLNWVNGKIWVNNHAHILAERKDFAILRFLYYVLQTCDVSSIVRGTPPKINQENLRNIEIPLPPLEIQAEIVRILDKFTQLEAELEAELDCRKRQYEFYRDQLLSFDKITPPERNNVVWKKLSEVASYAKTRINSMIIAPNSYVGVENLLKDKAGRMEHTKSPIGMVIEYMPNDILIGNIRPYLRKIWKANCKGGTNGDVLCIRLKKEKMSRITIDYLYHVLASETFFKYDIKCSKGAKMPRGDKSLIMKFEVPIPPVEEQNRIVAILDRFEALTTSLQHGLPAEIAARRQQYGYYRDKLLDFKRKNVQAECNKTCF